MKYHFKIHNDPDGLWAECIELEGCHTQGDSIDDLNFNMKEALNVYLDEPINSNIKDILPDPSIKGDDIVAVAVDPEIAFATTLRYYRLEHKITQKQMMEALGLKNIFSYQRLEKKTNPTLSTLFKIKKILPELDVNMILDA